MPKVYITNRDRITNRIKLLVLGKMNEQRLSRSAAADLTGKTRKTVNRHLDNIGEMSLNELLILFEALNINEQEIINL